MSVEASGGTGRGAPPSALTDQEEAARLDALRRYAILDTPPDAAFDRITGIAARLFGTPISLISLVDEDRLWFKSHHGLDLSEVARDPGLCDEAILQSGPYILEDARRDPRSADNPLVAGPFGLRFYCAAPLRTDDGHHLGTLCVIDQTPRRPDPALVRHLADLAAIVMNLIEMRAAARRVVDDKDAEISLRDTALSDADMMAREIDHRVKNDLQFISSLLSMQARRTGSKDAADALSSASSRVSAVARVHQHISVGPGAEDIACLDYLRRLCEDIADAMSVTITVDGCECEVPTRKIGKLGMLTNELVTNAIKHGDTPVRVYYGPDEDTGGCRLTVSDGGPGLPEDFDPQQSEGLGMRVVCSLVEQIEGTLHHGVEPGDTGATFTVRFTP